MYKIIDFHTHVCDKYFHDVFAHRNNIKHIITMPLKFPPEYTWDKLTKISGINRKSDNFCNFLKFDLNKVNTEHYIKTSSKKSIWYDNTNILKFIPVFDNFFVYKNIIDIEKYTDRMNYIISNTNQKIIMIHTGWGSSPIYFENVIKSNDDKIIVLAHMKEDLDADSSDRLYLLENYNNVYLEMSYISSPKRLKQYINKGFSDKILFGSDCRSREDYPTFMWMIDAIKRSEIPENDMQKILYNNAEKILL